MTEEKALTLNISALKEKISECAKKINSGFDDDGNAMRLLHEYEDQMADLKKRKRDIMNGGVFR